MVSVSARAEAPISHCQEGQRDGLSNDKSPSGVRSGDNKKDSDNKGKTVVRNYSLMEVRRNGI